MRAKAFYLTHSFAVLAWVCVFAFPVISSANQNVEWLRLCTANGSQVIQLEGETSATSMASDCDCAFNILPAHNTNFPKHYVNSQVSYFQTPSASLGFDVSVFRLARSPPAA